MIRKRLLIILCITLFVFILSDLESKPRIAVTFDDPNSNETPIFTWQQRNGMILAALNKFNIKAALFVCGKRVDNENGELLLKTWDDYGHLICNHSYSHLYYNSPKADIMEFWNDILKCDSIIKPFNNYTKLFRFPFLKEGATKFSRNFIRKKLKSIDYKIGYVSIDASDWYIDAQMSKDLSLDPKTDVTPYKEYLLAHLLNRASYYNDLAAKLTGREISHTILLHHSLLNALFLEDILKMFVANGWELIDAATAYKDDFYQTPPDIVPAGESIVWAKAKQTGKYEDVLRYPAEDSKYEEDSLKEYIKKHKEKKK